MGRHKPTQISVPGLIWCLIFPLWLGFLSGLFPGKKIAPGIWQAMQLHAYLGQKNAELAEREASFADLDHEYRRLRDDPAVQETEVRRILGYVASDEVVFDFSEKE